jgi:hypothetical protein
VLPFWLGVFSLWLTWWFTEFFVRSEGLLGVLPDEARDTELQIETSVTAPVLVLLLCGPSVASSSSLKHLGLLHCQISSVAFGQAQSTLQRQRSSGIISYPLLTHKHWIPKKSLVSFFEHTQEK